MNNARKYFLPPPTHGNTELRAPSVSAVAFGPVVRGPFVTFCEPPGSPRVPWSFGPLRSFSALFGLGSLNPQGPIGAAPPVPVVPIGADSCRNDLTVQAPNGTQRHPTAPIGTENIFFTFPGRSNR